MAISENLVEECAIFLMPLRAAIEDADELAALLKKVGFSLSSTQSAAVLAGIGNTFQEAFNKLSPPLDGGYDGATLLGAAFSAMRTIAGEFAQAAGADATESQRGSSTICSSCTSPRITRCFTPLSRESESSPMRTIARRSRAILPFKPRSGASRGIASATS